MAEAKAKQDKLIAKLDWLISRTKPDFKGNAAPFPKNKTLSSVKKAKVNESRLRSGEEYMSAKPDVPLSMHATRLGTVHRDSPVRYEQELPADPCRNPYHQLLDRDTNRPEVMSILQWRGQSRDERRTGKRQVVPPSTENVEDDWAANGARPTAKDVDMATPLQRLQLLRQDALEHPMFTGQSRLSRAKEFWDPMSQMGPNAIRHPPTKEKAPVEIRRNAVRMVGIMRRTQSSPAWR